MVGLVGYDEAIKCINFHALFPHSSGLKFCRFRVVLFGYISGSIISIYSFIVASRFKMESNKNIPLLHVHQYSEISIIKTLCKKRLLFTFLS